MTEISKRLKVNLKNVKRPINGVLPKKITRDVIGIEIPLRVFSRIKYDCNVYYAGKDKDIVITNEQQFLELLKENEVAEKPVIDVEPEVIDMTKISMENNTLECPIFQEVLKEANDEKVIEGLNKVCEEYTKQVEETTITPEETDNQLLNNISVYEEENTEQVEETPITTKDGATVGVRKNNKRNNRR